MMGEHVFNIFALFMDIKYFLKLFFKTSIISLPLTIIKSVDINRTIKIINQIFNLINLKSALGTGFILEFHNSFTLGT